MRGMSCHGLRERNKAIRSGASEPNGAGSVAGEARG